MAIVATGPSAYGVDFRKLSPDVHVIAVKGAIHSLQTVDSWITVDANERTREHMMRQRRFGVDYYAAVPADYGQPNARLLWHRNEPEKDIHYLHRIGVDRRGTPGLSEDRTAISTGNSAYGALGLAYHMRPRRIGLFGVDCTQAQYGIGGPGHPRGRLDHVPSLFLSAMPQLLSRGIEVILGSPNSKVLCFTRMNPRDVITWLNSGD